MPTIENHETQYPQALQAVRDGLEMLNSNPGDISELLGDNDPLAPHTIGQLLMEVLPEPEMDGLNVEAKKFWLDVATHMGPDWIAELRRVAAWMDRAESFR